MDLESAPRGRRGGGGRKGSDRWRVWICRVVLGAVVVTIAGADTAVGVVIMVVIVGHIERPGSI